MEEPVPIKPQQQNDVLQRELIEEPVPVQPCLQQQNSNLQVEDQLIQSIHVWSAYNSLISSPTHVTKVGALPLIAAPAHEWPTLLTILMQEQHITTKVVDPDRKTVISLNMGLYQPAKKLQMSRQDLQHLILRAGELHIVMAELRTIGAFIGRQRN